MSPELPIKPKTSSTDRREAHFTIIICTRQRCLDLQHTLESLAKVAVPSDWVAELLIVENGAKGRAEELVAGFRHDRIRARYRFVERPGKSNALNRAVSESFGEVLLFTDDDVRVPANWVAEMVNPLLRGDGEVVVGGSRLAPHLRREWMTRYHRGFLASTEYLNDFQPSEFAGVNVACRREVFSRVKGFDCELGGGGLGNCEDVLFARQLKQAGYRFVSKTTVCIEHHPSSSRLVYECWQQAALSSGRSEAYLIHHWYHTRISTATFRIWYYRLKLWLRLGLSQRRSPKSEGIPAWELSYRVQIAKWIHFRKERVRPRNYSLRGLRKLDVEIQSVTA